MRTENGHFLLAEPEKALLDYLYLNLAKIRSNADFDNIRLNRDQLRDHLDADKLRKYVAAFGVKKMEGWAFKCLP
jgi:hypothetical protein